MLRTLQNAGSDILHTIMRVVREHPAIAMGVVGVSALAVFTVVDSSAPAPEFFPPGPAGPQPPAGPLPEGTLPPATTSLTSYLSDAFFIGVHGFAAYMRSRGATIVSQDLIAMMLVESGCDPRVGNDIGCQGLNQICNLRGVGWTATAKEYRALPGEEQLVYVKRYFDSINRGKGNYPGIRDYGSLYLANFNPGHMGEADNFVLYKRDPNGPAANAPFAEWKAWIIQHRPVAKGGGGLAQDVYAENLGVDFGRKGYIEIADMARFVKSGVSASRNTAKWNELRMRLARTTGAANV